MALFQRALEQNYSDVSQKSLRWLQKILLSFAGLALLDAMRMLLRPLDSPWRLQLDLALSFLNYAAALLLLGKGEQVIGQYESPLLSPLANFFGRKSLKGFAVGDEGCAQFRERVSKITRLVKKLHEAQVPVLLGSDQGPHLFAPGMATGLEADALLNAGLSISDVMRSATTLAAQALGLENDVGKIAPGFRADAILLAHHPLAKAPWQQTPGAILVDGRWYGQAEREGLWQAASGHGSFWLGLGRFLQGDL